MSRRWTNGLLVAYCLLAVAFSWLLHVPTWTRAGELPTAQGTVSPQGAEETYSTESNRSTSHSAPEKAYDLLAKIQKRDGIPLPGYIGGKTFRNREHRLPTGRYREYDVNRNIPGRPRDAERIVIEQGSGKAYYTSDHYRTFTPLN